VLRTWPDRRLARRCPCGAARCSEASRRFALRRTVRPVPKHVAAKWNRRNTSAPRAKAHGPDASKTRRQPHARSRRAGSSPSHSLSVAPSVLFTQLFLRIHLGHASLLDSEVLVRVITRERQKKDRHGKFRTVASRQEQGEATRTRIVSWRSCHHTLPVLFARRCVGRCSRVVKAPKLAEIPDPLKFVALADIHLDSDRTIFALHSSLRTNPSPAVLGSGKNINDGWVPTEHGLAKGDPEPEELI
jgi:hypothetical protein